MRTACISWGKSREKTFRPELNVLDGLVRLVNGDRFHYPARARADASFLTTEGELNRRLQHDLNLDKEISSREEEGLFVP